MKNATVKIEEALLDVRKAYRLLHDYQRMVLDAVNYIGKQLGMSYMGGYPRYSNAAPREGKGGLDYWSWDWLNMVFYEFFFRPENNTEKGLRFSILLISDTGYFCAEDENLVATNVSAYFSPEQSSAKLGFLLSGPDWDEFTFLKSKAEMKIFVEKDGELPVEYAAKGIYGKCVDLARIASEEETNALIDEIVVFAKASGIPLKRIATKV